MVHTVIDSVCSRLYVVFDAPLASSVVFIARHPLHLPALIIPPSLFTVFFSIISTKMWFIPG
jgi:hypothetical protein